MGCKFTEAPLTVGALANFRVQPMLACGSHEIVGYELLFRNRIDFSDKQQMLEVDIAALKAARFLCMAYKSKKRVHCNVEISSMLNLDWVVAMAEHVAPGMVIEIVERNELVRNHWGFQQLKSLCRGIRDLGGEIALDDVSGTVLEEKMIEVFRPSVLKANDRRGLDFIASLGTGAIVVAEHIESFEIASQAVVLGASELQGYWCDVLKEHEVPAILTPPGVTARNQQLLLAAA